MNSIKVLYINHTSRLGGGEIALLSLVRHLDRRKIEPEVVLLSPGPLADRIGELGIPTHIIELSDCVLEARKDGLGLKSLLEWRAINHSLGVVLRIWHVLRRVRPDVVHTNSLKSDLLGGAAARLAGIPLVWHVRDRITDDYLPVPVVRAFRLLAGLIPQWIVANSAATLATLQLPPGKPFTVVPSGLAPGEIMPDPGPSDPAARLTTFGLIGRIAPWKGQHVFIRAAAAVHRRFPHTRFRIIGRPMFGESAYEVELRKLSAHCGLDGALSFLGFRQDIPRVLQELDVVVHASTTGEPFGQVVVQALAAAKPVVATAGGAIPEIVEHGKSGLLVPMGDAQSMADAMIQLASNPRAAREMGHRGPAVVQEKFTIAITTARLLEVYKSLSEHDRQCSSDLDYGRGDTVS